MRYVPEAGQSTFYPRSIKGRMGIIFGAKIVIGTWAELDLFCRVNQTQNLS